MSLPNSFLNSVSPYFLFLVVMINTCVYEFLPGDLIQNTPSRLICQEFRGRNVEPGSPSREAIGNAPSGGGNFFNFSYFFALRTTMNERGPVNRDLCDTMKTVRRVLFFSSTAILMGVSFDFLRDQVEIKPFEQREEVLQVLPAKKEKVASVQEKEVGKKRPDIVVKKEEVKEKKPQIKKVPLTIQKKDKGRSPDYSKVKPVTSQKKKKVEERLVSNTGIEFNRLNHRELFEEYRKVLSQHGQPEDHAVESGHLMAKGPTPKKEPKVIVHSPESSDYNPFLPETYGSEEEESFNSLDLVAKMKEGLQKSPALANVQNRLAGSGFPATQRRPQSHSFSKAMSSHAGLSISARTFSFGKGDIGPYKGFEIRPDYSDAERWDGGREGTVTLQKSLNSSMGIIPATVRGQGIVDMRVDLVLERGVDRQVGLPVFGRGEFSEMLERRGLSGGGGHLFVELDDSTDSLSLDAQTEGAIFLDSSLNPVQASDDHRYLLFVGVHPGSTTIEYVRNGYENLKKVVLIEEGRLYYEPNEYLEVGDDVVQIDLKRTLGQQEGPLNVKGDKIVQFNSYEESSQLGPGRYDLSVNVVPSGMRKYVELHHLDSPIYLGRWNAKRSVVPADGTIEHFLGAMGLENGLSGACVVQINLGGVVKDLHIEGRNGRHYIPIDKIYLNKDGSFSREISPLSSQVFVMSDQTGVFGLRVQYEGGKEDFLSSYCASSSYLVEQL